MGARVIIGIQSGGFVDDQAVCILIHNRYFLHLHAGEHRQLIPRPDLHIAADTQAIQTDVPLFERPVKRCSRQQRQLPAQDAQHAAGLPGDHTNPAHAPLLDIKQLA